MSRRTDPAKRKPGDAEPPAFDFKKEAAERIREAGHCLRLHLNAEPRRIDDLDALEMDVLRQTQGRSYVDRTMNRAAQLDRIERQAQRVRRPEDRVRRVRFTMAEHVSVPVRDDNDGDNARREFTR